MATGARYEKLDHSDLAAALRAEQERKPAGPTPGIPDLEALELATGRIRTRRASVEAIATEAEIDVQRIDERLKDQIRADLALQTRHAAASRTDAAMREMNEELEGLRAAVATHFDPDVLRRRATFHREAGQDATIRTAWMARLSAASDRALEGFAADAFASSNLALGQLVLEQIDGRANADLELRGAVKRHVDAIPVPGAEAARKKLHESEDAFADARERVGVLRGGRPSGMAQIRRGVQQLQRERSA